MSLNMTCHRRSHNILASACVSSSLLSGLAISYTSSHHRASAQAFLMGHLHPSPVTRLTILFLQTSTSQFSLYSPMYPWVFSHEQLYYFMQCFRTDFIFYFWYFSRAYTVLSVDKTHLFIYINIIFSFYWIWTLFPLKFPLHVIKQRTF